ncbi:hypothetical protein GCM10010220_54900 [Streptomyces parvulus]|nr:hypothetical protein GCM10010220_54900 [Streptomyces parvulus]
MAVVLPGHLAAVALAARSDAVAPVPLAEPGAALSPLMEQAAVMGLRLLDIPLPLPPVAIGMAWHPRRTSDGAHHWLRGAVRRVLRVSWEGTGVRGREAPDGSRHERGATARLRVPSVGTRSP